MLRRKVQWAHDHLREHPGLTPREGGQVAGARTMAAAVLAMISRLERGEPIEDRPVLRLVPDSGIDENRTGER